MENKGLINVEDCPCDGCPAKPCGHPARCLKFTCWINMTVDAVKVVRCKECKHWAECDDYGGMCENPDGLDNYAMPDDFCSYGERRTE